MRLFRYQSNKYEGRNGTIRFCASFLISIVVLTVLYIYVRNSIVIEPFLDLNARLATTLWNLFGDSVDTDGAFIYSTDFKFHVTAECTSIAPTFIFLSAVIAWPSTFKEKLSGTLISTVALFIINLIRMLTLFYIGFSFPDYLDLFHYYIWQGFIVILALGLWVFWINKMVCNSAFQSFKANGDTT